MRAIWWKKCFVYFLLAKYTPMSRKNGGQKQNGDTLLLHACVGSYFIPDENIQKYLICLQSCNMQKHQKANFRTAEYVCVQQWWLKMKVSIMHVSWPVTSWNTCSHIFYMLLKFNSFQHEWLLNVMWNMRYMSRETCVTIQRTSEVEEVFQYYFGICSQHQKLTRINTCSWSMVFVWS